VSLQASVEAFTEPTQQGEGFCGTARWEGVPREKWEDYHWQMRNSLKTLEDLRSILRLTPSEEAALGRRENRFAMSIPPYWASLMEPEDPRCPIRMQAVPVEDEYTIHPTDLVDPLAEEHYMPVPGLVHRYPDRVLLLVVGVCAMYCRYCTRSRVVGRSAGFSQPANIEKALDYIRRHPQIRDVLVSGGDPLSLSDRRLDSILTRLKAIPHVEFVRIGTRSPVTVPCRVTESLCDVLRKHKPVWMSLHFSHPKEVTPAVENACNLLADAGVPLGSQTVLLKGINDDAETMKRLFHKLLQIRVRPYYIYQCDAVRGTSHLRAPLDKGIEIMEALRGHTSGYAVPTFVVDTCRGKIPVAPNYIVSRADSTTVLRNYAGKTFEYRDV